MNHSQVMSRVLQDMQNKLRSEGGPPLDQALSGLLMFVASYNLAIGDETLKSLSVLGMLEHATQVFKILIENPVTVEQLCAALERAAADEQFLSLHRRVDG